MSLISERERVRLLEQEWNFHPEFDGACYAGAMLGTWANPGEGDEYIEFE